MVSINYWGPIYWRFLHLLTTVLPEDIYVNNRDQIIDIIKEICNNIPCPTCQEHATHFMKKVRWNNVKTKRDFYFLIHGFHNTVNKQLKKPELSEVKSREYIASLNVKDSTMEFIKIVPQNNPGVVVMLGLSKMRKTAVRKIYGFLKDHKSSFEL